MDWKRTLSLTLPVLFALAARADQISELLERQEKTKATPGDGLPPLKFEPPIDPNQCQLGSRRYGCSRHPFKGTYKGKGRNKQFIPRVSFHQGWDIQARPEGNPELRSVGNGVVFKAERMGPCGLAVKIKLDNGLFTTYCHMSSLSKNLKAGDRVEPGQVVGEMGSTGSSDGVHLHFVLAACDDSQKCAINPTTLLDPDKVCKESLPDKTRGSGC